MDDFVDELPAGGLALEDEGEGVGREDLDGVQDGDGFCEGDWAGVFAEGGGGVGVGGEEF